MQILEYLQAMTPWTQLLAIWAVVGPVLAFTLGSGFWWKWDESKIQHAQLDLNKAEMSLNIRREMNTTLEEILKLERDSPIRKAKIDYFNASERHLAQNEGRSPVFYKIEATLNKTLDDVTLKCEGTVK